MAATRVKPAAEKLDPAVVKTALILIAGGMAVIFDTTIVSVALHTLSVKLDTPVATIQWVTTGYLLALGIAVPLSTWGLQRFGGKRLWMFSLAVFLVGSVGSSLAWDVGSLIGWRVVQGIGGGLMLPLMTTLIFQAAGGKSLGRLVTYVAMPALLGPILGPLIGGAILTHLSWRFMFWVNVPFCVIGILLAWRYLNIDPRSTWRSGGPRASPPSPCSSPCGSPAPSGRPRPVAIAPPASAPIPSGSSGRQLAPGRSGPAGPGRPASHRPGRRPAAPPWPCRRRPGPGGVGLPAPVPRLTAGQRLWLAEPAEIC